MAGAPPCDRKFFDNFNKQWPNCGSLTEEPDSPFPPRGIGKSGENPHPCSPPAPSAVGKDCAVCHQVTRAARIEQCRGVDLLPQKSPVAVLTELRRACGPISPQCPPPPPRQCSGAPGACGLEGQSTAGHPTRTPAGL